MESIGSRLELLRQFARKDIHRSPGKKLTQKQIVDNTGISKSTLHSILHNAFDPGVRHIKKLAQFFRVSTDFIIMGDDYKPEISVSQLINASIDEDMRDSEIKQELFQAIHSMNEEESEKARDMLAMVFDLDQIIEERRPKEITT